MTDEATQTPPLPPGRKLRNPAPLRPRRNKTELGDLAAEYTEQAMDAIVQLLELSTDEKVRLAAAREILDRHTAGQHRLSAQR